MSKKFLMILGVVILLMGIWGLIPSWHIAGVADPMWHAVAKILVGGIALYISMTEK